MKKAWVLFLMLALCLAALPAQAAAFTPEAFPVIDGATALAPYYEAVAAKLLDLPVEEARQYVLCSTTGPAFENLTSGYADMIFCSPPSDAQTQAATDAGVAFEIHPLFNNGFVFFVNKDNPVERVTMDDLRGIYAGRITNWKQLGGEDMPIVAYQRAEGSGSQTGLYRFVLPKDEVMEVPTEQMLDTMEGAVNTVAAEYENSVGSICFSFYYYVANMRYTDQIKLLTVDGVVPNEDTISRREYPMISRSSAILRADEPMDSPARAVLDFVLSEEGKALGRENHYVCDAGES